MIVSRCDTNLTLSARAATSVGVKCASQTRSTIFNAAQPQNSECRKKNKKIYVQRKNRHVKFISHF